MGPRAREELLGMAHRMSCPTALRRPADARPPLAAGRRLAGLSALALACLSAPPTQAQAPPAKAQAPVAAGPGSLAGIWVRENDPSGLPTQDYMFNPRERVLTTDDNTPLPTQPWAAEIVEKRLQAADAGRPYASTKTRCLPGGVPDMMFGSGPMQILETPGQVTILRQEFTFFRVIHLGGTHPADFDPGFLGHSVGRWEGPTLVVDTVGISDKTTIKEVIPHTEDMHVVERYRRIDKDTLEITAVIEDPKTFTKPWRMITRLKPLNRDLQEYFCENNRNVAGEDGYITTLLPKPAQ